MCGLFGVLAPTSINRREATRLRDEFLYLGQLAEERGLAAAGFAELLPNGEQRLRRRIGRFSELAATLDDSQPAEGYGWIGHTRWPTQGAVTLPNTSPLRAGPVLGTHNGDIDTTTLPTQPVPDHRREGTDSHALLAALAALRVGRGYPERVATLLAQVQGRAALVWRDARDPRGRVWLARSGLSPLAVATDTTTGAIWWASNPDWLRELGLHPFLLPHGSLWSIRPTATRAELTLLTTWVPTVRHSDLRLLDTAVWRNFTDADRDVDLALLTYRLAPRQPERLEV